MEQELLTLPEDMSLHPVFCGFRVARSSDYPFGIFKLFLDKYATHV